MSRRPHDLRTVADRRLAVNVRRLRHEARLSQVALAARMAELGHRTWRQRTVSELELDLRFVSIGEAVDLADVLAVELEDLLR